MNGHTVILSDDLQRQKAKKLIDAAPVNAVINVKEAKRTLDQNALMWSLLGELSRAKPQGRVHGPDTWKLLVMHACGHTCQFEHGLDGQPFPAGFASSRLTKSQMSDLIEFIYSYGTEHGVRFNHPREAA